MSDQFDPNAFLNQFGGAAQAAKDSGDPVSNQPIDVEGFDPDRFIEQNTLNTTGDPVPSYVAGDSVATARPESPLSISERFQLKSLGNQKGQLGFLRKKFDDAQVGKDGRIKVLDNGIWKQADPDNDAWETTKNLLSAGINTLSGTALDPSESEAVKDVADVGRELGLIGAGIAVGVATGGAGLPAILAAEAGAAGALTAGLTSWGRLVGTYDATPQEQLRDVVEESAFAAVGAGLAAGVKPTAKWAAQGVKRMGKAISKSSAPILRDALSAVGSPMGDFLDTVVKHGDEVSRKMAVNNGDANRFTRAKVDAILNVADEGDKALSKMWQDGSKSVQKLAGKDSKINIQEPLREMFKDAANEGLLTVNGKQGAAALVDIANAKDLKKLKILPANMKELENFRNATGRLAEESFEPETFQQIQNFLKQATRQTKNIDSVSVDQVMNLKKGLGKITYGVQKSSEASGLLKSTMARYSELLDSGVERTLGEKSPAALREYVNLNSRFSKARGGMQELLDIKKAARRGAKAELDKAAMIADRLFTGKRTGATSELAMNEAMEAIKQSGLKVPTQRMQASLLEIEQLKAAEAFTPRLKSPSLGGVGAGAVAALIDPGMAAGLGLASASPRLQFRAVQAMNKTGLAGLKLLKSQPVKVMKEVAGSEIAMRRYFQGIVGSGYRAIGKPVPGEQDEVNE